jgi:hypothetical protein
MSNKVIAAKDMGTMLALCAVALILVATTDDEKETVIPRDEALLEDWIEES